MKYGSCMTVLVFSLCFELGILQFFPLVAQSSTFMHYLTNDKILQKLNFNIEKLGDILITRIQTFSSESGENSVKCLFFPLLSKTKNHRKWETPS